LRAIEPIARVPLKDELAAVVREAGALAASTFRTELKSWTKGGGSVKCMIGDLGPGDEPETPAVVGFRHEVRYRPGSKVASGS